MIIGRGLSGSRLFSDTTPASARRAPDPDPFSSVVCLVPVILSPPCDVCHCLQKQSIKQSSQCFVIILVFWNLDFFFQLSQEQNWKNEYCLDKNKLYLQRGLIQLSYIIRLDKKINSPSFRFPLAFFTQNSKCYRQLDQT